MWVEGWRSETFAQQNIWCCTSEAEAAASVCLQPSAQKMIIFMIWSRNVDLLMCLLRSSSGVTRFWVRVLTRAGAGPLSPSAGILLAAFGNSWKWKRVFFSLPMIPLIVDQPEGRSSHGRGGTSTWNVALITTVCVVGGEGGGVLMDTS